MTIFAQSDAFRFLTMKWFRFLTMKWLGLTAIDWSMLALYFVVILAIGIWSSRKVKDMADFFMGGRRFGKVFMMFFAFGAGTSSEQAISVVAGTWRAGLAGIWWQFLWLWATPFYWIVAPIMRRMRALTTADFFQTRYNTATATLYTLYGIVMSIVFIAGGLYGSGKMVNALTGGELDHIARGYDVQVPELAWDTKIKRFGRRLMFELSETETAAAQRQLDAGTVPKNIRAALVLQKKVSQKLTVSPAESPNRWLISDSDRGVSYPVRLSDDEQPIISIYGSGWRLLEGYEFAILAMTVVFVIYGMAGGLGAAILTDFIQGVLTIVFSFLLLPFVFNMIGGFGHLHGQAGIKTGMLDLVAGTNIAATLGKEPITAFYVFMLSATALSGIVVQPHIMGVCGAGKTEFEGRFGFTFGNFLKRFCTVAWTFTGLACIVWYLGSSSPLIHADVPLTPDSGAAFQKLTPAEQQQNLAAFSALPEKQQDKIRRDRQAYHALSVRNNSGEYQKLSEAEQTVVDRGDKNFADALFGRAAYDILPTIANGLIGLLLASLLAAVMSTSDAQMIISSGLFTENIYRRFLVRGRSQRHYLWVGRIAGLLIVVCALVLQASFSDVIAALKVIIKTPAFIGISLWFGITWRRWNSYAVWTSTAAGVLSWVAVVGWFDTIYKAGVLPDWMFSFDGQHHLIKMTDAWQMFWFMSVGIGTGIVVSLLTPRQPKEKLDHFFRLMHTPVTPGEVVPAPCTLPENPAPPGKKLFNIDDIEIQKPTVVGLGGFLLAWVAVGIIIWLTRYLAKVL